ncbi:WXG100 family type VII secretion target [Streptomyces niveiscabiei]|uniref:WXG100 family type VII secretion target n=1 Tax=Streptomyces niveiscabiei TaxID=164115 RepID=UPI0029A6DB41|nr:WXG100 family type VII secretion target [Streptomyces niveiscabiei]MDX3382743.1 WXG100 family type VII secretion target [Streptomyces niveiscabiei]
MGTPDLKATHDELSRLANDLDDMRDHLDGQVVRMDAIVDRIEAGWRGPAGTAYREFHRAAAEDAVRIREVVKLLAEAVRLSRDGFSATDLDVLDRIRAVQVDVASEVARLSTPNSQAAPGTSRSTLDAY